MRAPDLSGRPILSAAKYTNTSRYRDCISCRKVVTNAEAALSLVTTTLKSRFLISFLPHIEPARSRRLVALCLSTVARTKQVRICPAIKKILKKEESYPTESPADSAAVAGPKRNWQAPPKDGFNAQPKTHRSAWRSTPSKIRKEEKRTPLSSLQTVVGRDRSTSTIEQIINRHGDLKEVRKSVGDPSAATT